MWNRYHIRRRMLLWITKRQPEKFWKKSAAEIILFLLLTARPGCVLSLKIMDVCDSKAVENIDGVKGVFFAQGQLQIIFGTGIVNKVYDAFIQEAGITESSKEDVKQAANARQNVFKRAIKTLGDIFVPIIPAIVASGFLMGIMEALNFMVNNGFLNISTTSSIYVFAQLFSNTAYTFLPILIAYSAGKASAPILIWRRLSV